MYTTKMDFVYGVLALLAFVVLILTVLTAWMYVQQSRITQAVSALTAAITAPPPAFLESAKEFPIESMYEAAQSVGEAETKDEVIDDRVSVHEEDDQPEEESEEDESDQHEDDLGGKTVAQLRDMLTAKGIPFNKSDKKPVLLNLLKVAS